MLKTENSFCRVKIEAVDKYAGKDMMLSERL